MKNVRDDWATTASRNHWPDLATWPPAFGPKHAGVSSPAQVPSNGTADDDPIASYPGPGAGRSGTPMPSRSSASKFGEYGRMSSPSKSSRRSVSDRRFVQEYFYGLRAGQPGIPLISERTPIGE